MGFKLYDVLISQIDVNSQMSLLEKKHCLTINRLSTEHRIRIYLIMYHYYKIKNNNNNAMTLPYMGKLENNSKGIIFNCNNLPIELQNIIVKYIDMNMM